MPSLLEESGELLRDFLVLDREKSGEGFHQRDLRTEVGEDRSELAAHGTGTDHQHRLRDALDVQDVVGIEDLLAVRLDVREITGNRTHRENDVLRLERARLLAL